MPAADPTAIGPYSVRAKIGEGGMGVVYLGSDERGRNVAIKVLRSNVVGDDDGRARMAREVTSLRRVRSPRVAEVYDAEPWAETPYLVTRYVTGPSLADHVRQVGPLSSAELRDLAIGLAEAIVAVHTADVVHRDVKPSNVLLEHGHPVLIDFGIAQLADDSKLTSIGWMLGTPGYLAPEILYGGDPTPQADVHAWGATIAFAATGRAPFGSGPAVAVMDRVRRGEHDLEGIPDWLGWIVRQAIAADPGDRPTSAQLLRMLAGGPEVAGTTTLQPIGGAHAAPPIAAMEPRTLETEITAPPIATTPLGRSMPPVYSDGPVVPTEYPTPGQVAAAHRSMAHPREAPMGLQVVFWLAILALLIGATVTAPVAAAAGLIAACWLLRSIAKRNPITALPATIGHAIFVLLDGASVGLLLTVTTPPRTLNYVLMASAFIAGLFAWWGPLSGDVREGGRIVTGALLRSQTNALLVLVLIAAGCGAVVLLHETAGPVYDPLPEPPWKPLISDHL